MPAAPDLTPAETEELAETVGKIAGFAARTLHEEYPHLDAAALVDQFTRGSAAEMVAADFMTGIERGLTPDQAAGAAGKALIEVWAEARLEAARRTA